MYLESFKEQLDYLADASWRWPVGRYLSSRHCSAVSMVSFTCLPVKLGYRYKFRRAGSLKVTRNASVAAITFHDNNRGVTL